MNARCSTCGASGPPLVVPAKSERSRRNLQARLMEGTDSWYHLPGCPSHPLAESDDPTRVGTLLIGRRDLPRFGVEVSNWASAKVVSEALKTMSCLKWTIYDVEGPLTRLCCGGCGLLQPIEMLSFVGLSGREPHCGTCNERAVKARRLHMARAMEKHFGVAPGSLERWELDPAQMVENHNRYVELSSRYAQETGRAY